MSVLNNTVQLTGIQLLRLLRAFTASRCDALGLQGYNDWLEALDAREEDEEAFLRKAKELLQRGEFCSLAATKAFASSVCSGTLTFNS